MRVNPLSITTIIISLAGTHASAQWTDESTDHLTVADGVGEQVQPKIAATPDGGCYISWYSSETGYDVRLQRLDVTGNEMWTHNGLLIADRGFSSTQDYDLDIDTNGNAVLVFRDDRFTGTRITAQSIDPNGAFLWGANGVQFGNGTDFVGSPDIATTSEGSTIIGWINENDTHLAKINPDGTSPWTTILSDPGGELINIASMHGSDNGSVIISWVQRGPAFFNPKHLYAQKINADGSEAWASRAAIFDNGSLQFGNFPEFVADSAGGAVFSWYDTANGLNVYAQHLNTDGSQRYPQNGVAASTFPRERVSPTAGYDPSTDSVYVSWIELDNNQGDQGIYTQRLDNTGSRMWTDSGIELSPINNLPSGSINIQVSDNQITTLWIQGLGGFGQDTVLAHAVSTNGDDAWADGTVEVASDPATRSRLTTATSTDGFIIGAWQIGDFGVADIETHNLNQDGSLGAASCPADLNGDGDLNFFDVSAFLSAFGMMNPAADFTGDGDFNFFDVSAFLADFAIGCP